MDKSGRMRTLAPMADRPGRKQRSHFTTFKNWPFSVVLKFFLLVDSNYHSDYLVILRDIIQEGKGASNSYHKTRKTRKPHPWANQKRFNTRPNNYWPLKGKTVVCCAHFAKNKETGTHFRCREWNVRLCAGPFCEVYHTKLYFWEPSYTELEKWQTDISKK